MYYPPSSLIATGIILPLLGVASTATRFWIRLSYQPNPIGKDDWIIVVGAVIVMSLGIMQVFDAIYGELGNDAALAGKKAVVRWKADYAQVIIEKFAFGSIKLSILFFYRRIFGRWSGFLRLNRVLMVLIIVWTSVYAVGEILVCGTHPGIAWSHHDLADEKCMNHGIFLVSFAASDVFTDLLVIGMPLPFIHRLQISSRQKWGLVAVFSMGFLSTLAGILRLGFLSVLYQYGQFVWNPPPLAHPPKVLTYINPIFWTNVELCFGVVAANLMTFAPLIRKGNKAKQVTSQAYGNSTLAVDPLEQSKGEKSKASAATDSVNALSTIYTNEN